VDTASEFTEMTHIDALAASMLMPLARQVDFAAACPVAPYDKVPDSGRVP
jgi:hypothetical protein